MELKTDTICILIKWNAWLSFVCPFLIYFYFCSLWFLLSGRAASILLWPRVNEKRFHLIRIRITKLKHLRLNKKKCSFSKFCVHTIYRTCLMSCSIILPSFSRDVCRLCRSHFCTHPNSLQETSCNIFFRRMSWTLAIFLPVVLKLKCKFWCSA